jgi:hypothetical protein
MQSKSTKSLLAAAVTLLIISVGAVFARGDREQGAAVTGSPQVLIEILSELRQLRKTIQADRVNGYRGLILIERVRSQQEHVDRLDKELQEIRVDLSSNTATLPQMLERVKDFESQVEGEQDQARKSQLESELHSFKAMVEQQVLRQRQQQQRDLELSSRLEGERAKLNDLNQKLQALEGD